MVIVYITCTNFILYLDPCICEKGTCMRNTICRNILHNLMFVCHTQEWNQRKPMQQHLLFSKSRFLGPTYFCLIESLIEKHWRGKNRSSQILVENSWKHSAHLTWTVRTKSCSVLVDQTETCSNWQVSKERFEQFCCRAKKRDSNKVLSNTS